jgi:hydroxymethylbilane synthase
MVGLIAGSRGSKLAITQTAQIADAIDADVDIHRIVTRGDKITDVALAKVEGKAFFTKEIDDALLRGEVDFAVHSYKDVPTDLPEGLVVAAIPPRESARDALVSEFRTLDELPTGARVGTSSLRRQAQVLRARSDARVLDLRGNVDTRVAKLAGGEYDAIVIAEAGLRRLGYTDFHPIDPLSFIPAAGQGALAVIAREEDGRVMDLLLHLDDAATRLAVESEREFLSALEGGCQIPAGAHAVVDMETERVSMTGFIATVDGRVSLVDSSSGPSSMAIGLARTLASRLLTGGGRAILDDIRDGGEDRWSSI